MMAAISETHAALRIHGEALDPDDISARLGGRPSSSARKGDVVGKDGAGRERVAISGRWILTVPRREPGNRDAQIQDLLGALTSDLRVWRSLAQSYTIDVFAGLFLKASNEGFALSPLTLALLAERGLTLSFDVYAPLEDDA